MSCTSISVILPAYNSQAYLGDAVESILAQTFSDFELILFDDGSTDCTLQLSQRYEQQDSRVKVVSQPNRGLLGVLRHGVKLAKAPLIARMDADDIAEPTRFQKQVDYLRVNPECVALGSQVMRIDSDGAPLCAAPISQEHDQIERELLENLPGKICHPTVIMRTDAVRQVGGYQQDYHYEDVDLFLRLAEIGKLANLDEPLLQYRLHASSICHTRDQARIDSIYKSIVSQACSRRGLPVTNDQRQQPATQAQPPTDAGLDAAYAWTALALEGGYRRTAWKHAWRAFRMKKNARSMWAISCCLIGRKHSDRFFAGLGSLKRSAAPFNGSARNADASTDLR